MYFDRRRLSHESFSLNRKALQEGYFSDKYFQNISSVLEALAEASESFEAEGGDVATLREVGQREVEMQIFPRRRPYTVVAGVDEALAVLREGAGYWEGESFQSAFSELEVEALYDGELVLPWEPVLRIRGRYLLFAQLETVLLGILSRQSKVATNVYEVLEAAGGKPVFFFPARYDLPEVQAHDGYAYKVAIDRYNHEYGTQLPYLISTDAQGSRFDCKGQGTTSHSYLLCFLRDTPKAMYWFAKILPPTVRRIALVDVNNDCVGDAVAVAKLFFLKYWQALEEGHRSEAERFRLHGVRLDTADNMRDVSVPPLGDPHLDLGVVPRLVWAVREALDQLADGMGLEEAAREEARAYFRSVQIVCTGGFTAEKVALFERLKVPVDVYGLGSHFFEKKCDFTADVVRVRQGGEWIPMAKEGRRVWENPKLEPVS